MGRLKNLNLVNVSFWNRKVHYNYIKSLQSDLENEVILHKSTVVVYLAIQVNVTTNILNFANKCKHS